MSWNFNKDVVCDFYSNYITNVAESGGTLTEQADKIKESIPETTKAIDQIASTAQNQAELAQNLNEMIQKFKI